MVQMNEAGMGKKKPPGGPLVYALIGLIVLVFAGIIFYNAQRQKYDSVRINLLGRQRMLAEKISTGVLLYKFGKVARNTIAQNINLFDSTLHALTYGGQVDMKLDMSSPRTIPGFENPKIQSLLSNIILLWEAEEIRLKGFLEHGDDQQLTQIISAHDTLLTLIDQAVYLTQTESEVKNAVGHMIAYLLLIVAGMVLAFFFIFNLRRKSQQLKVAKAHITQLETLLPICSSCKRIRNSNTDPKDMHSWLSIEEYFSENEHTQLTHGICPDCLRKLYPESAQRILGM